MRKIKHIGHIQRNTTPVDIIVGAALGLLIILATAFCINHCKTIPNVADVKHAELLSIAEAEVKYNIEVLMPSPRELQEWCVRKGAPNVPIDNELGDLTEDGMDWVRCQQEASKHNYIVEKEFWY